MGSASTTEPGVEPKRAAVAVIPLVSSAILLCSEQSSDPSDLASDIVVNNSEEIYY